MNSIRDLLLPPPLPDAAVDFLLFLLFWMHFLFVLLTIGTGALGVASLVRHYIRKSHPQHGPQRGILRTFLVHKSLAIILGVGALLVIQVGYTVPFFTATSLLAPFWIWIIPVLIASFLAYDYAGQTEGSRLGTHLVLGVIGLVLLMVVPAIFTAVLVLSENSSQWENAARAAYRVPVGLAAHWALRYVHVVGAGLVIGAAFHLFFTASKENAAQRSWLTAWFWAALMGQILLGVMLYGSLPHRPDVPTTALMLIGIAAAAALLWIGIYNKFSLRRAVPLLLTVVTAMLLVRQSLQFQAFKPVVRKARAHAEQYAAALSPYKQQSLDMYRRESSTAYDRGDVIYRRSCSFCHGADGSGRGSEASNLIIPPEQLSAIRTTPEALRRTLLAGVPGTGMPYFSYWDPRQLDLLLRHMQTSFHVFDAPPPFGANADPAEQVFTSTCAVCHGRDGRLTSLSRGFEPPPPDFSTFTVTPARAFEVISNGYPGTPMGAYSELAESLRWGLVAAVRARYRGGR